jgi:hypothetical protein
VLRVDLYEFGLYCKIAVLCFHHNYQPLRKHVSTHAQSLLPVSRTQINRLASAHIVHDLLDAPRLVLVALGVIGLKGFFVFHVDTLLQALGALGVVLVGVGFGVVAPDPFG